MFVWLWRYFCLSLMWYSLWAMWLWYVYRFGIDLQIFFSIPLFLARRWNTISLPVVSLFPCWDSLSGHPPLAVLFWWSVVLSFLSRWALVAGGSCLRKISLYSWRYPRTPFGRCIFALLRRWNKILNCRTFSWIY